MFVERAAGRVHSTTAETHMVPPQSLCMWLHTHVHPQNKHNNPGLEELSDDTEACITAKTFTLLFFSQSFHLPIVFAVAFVFHIVMGTSSSFTTDGGSGTHSKGKHSQGLFKQGYLHKSDEWKLNQRGADAGKISVSELLLSSRQSGASKSKHSLYSLFIYNPYECSTRHLVFYYTQS